MCKMCGTFRMVPPGYVYSIPCARCYYIFASPCARHARSARYIVLPAYTRSASCLVEVSPRVRARSARYKELGWEKGGPDNHFRSSTNPMAYPSIVPTSVKPVLVIERIAMCPAPPKRFLRVCKRRQPFKSSSFSSIERWIWLSTMCFSF